MTVRDATASGEALALLASHVERPSTLEATAARAQFFPLLESVVLDPGTNVFVEHKDLPGRGMLVGEQYHAYVQKLEQVVRALTEPAPVTPFRLAGSITCVTAPDAAIAESRADQARETRAKFASL